MQMARHHKRPNQQGGKKKNTFGGWRAARQVKAPSFSSLVISAPLLMHEVLLPFDLGMERWQPLVLLRLERERFGRWRQFFRFAILGGSGQKVSMQRCVLVTSSLAIIDILF
jgi:hypothetical protein